MIEQVGPQKLLEQLKEEAPRYAKLLPELPRLTRLSAPAAGHRSAA
jgi:hypothetical protein